MTSRELVIKTLNHEPVERLARDPWASPGVKMLHGEELRNLLVRFPSDFAEPDFRPPHGRRASETPLEVGRHTDAWGCTWSVARRGTRGRIVGRPLSDLSQVDGYRVPARWLDRADFSGVDAGCAATSRFVLARTDVRPLERLGWLHGIEQTHIDLAYGKKKLLDLLAMIHEFHCRQLQRWAETDVDGVVLGDAWGAAQSAWIAPALWNEIFRPLYEEYCDILRAGDKFVFFDGEGDLGVLFPDLAEIGVDAVNADLSRMDVGSLARQFRGRITFWGEIDRRRVLPFGTTEKVRSAVTRLRDLLDFGQGGVIARCPWDLDVPLANVTAALDQWNLPTPARF